MIHAVFLGTPAAAVPALAALRGVASIDLVVTRADKPRGRSGRPQPSPVKEAASEWGLEVRQPETAAELTTVLAGTGADVGIVVAYGHILRSEALASLPGGFLNVHFSHLPRWRGAAPVSHAILNGDATTGVTLIAVDAGLDTGPVVARTEPVPVGDHDRGSLTALLAAAGAGLLAGTLAPYMAGAMPLQPQDDAAATRAPMLTKAGGRIGWDVPAGQVRRHIRAFSPKPGAWAELDGAPLRILGAGDIDGGGGPAGTVIEEAGRVWLWCGEGRVQLTTVHPGGGRRVDAASWWHGRRGRTTHLV